jgi:hypothetical protein
LAGDQGDHLRTLINYYCMKFNRKIFRAFVFFAFLFQVEISTTQKIYTPTKDPCGCDFWIEPDFVKIAPPKLKTDVSQPFGKIDGFKTRCDYLVAPEKRSTI